jgi:uncharacterized protein YidB (DUF937 family)
MGLMDVLRGMSNGPHGQSSPSGSTGISPFAMGLLALLAYKSMGHGRVATAAPPSSASKETPNQALSSGDWMSGLGRMISGGAAGSIVSGGLGQLVSKFQESGQAGVANSWVGTGPNSNISPGDLEKTVGGDMIDALARQTGMSRDSVLAELAEHLPKTVDALTPQGHVPSPTEAAKAT